MSSLCMFDWGNVDAHVNVCYAEVLELKHFGFQSLFFRMYFSWWLNLKVATKSTNRTLLCPMEESCPIVCAEGALRKALFFGCFFFQNFSSICQVSRSQWSSSGRCFGQNVILSQAVEHAGPEAQWCSVAAWCHCWSVLGGSVVPVLFSSFVSKHLFPYVIFGRVGQWGPVSLHWESISTFYEMVFRIWFARNEWLSSTSSTKHSWYKWDMHLVSSVFYISRMFVNNCILFLVLLYNTPPLQPLILYFLSLLVCHLCLQIVWPPMLTTVLVLRASIVGQGRLGDENCYLPGEQLLCPEISSPLYCGFAGAIVRSCVLLLSSQHCWWLSENALHSLCRGKQALGTNSLLA